MLGIVGLAWFLVLVDDTATAVALPSMGRDLGLGLAGLEWAVNVYTLAFAVLALAVWAGTARLDVLAVACWAVAGPAVHPSAGQYHKVLRQWC